MADTKVMSVDEALRKPVDSIEEDEDGKEETGDRGSGGARVGAKGGRGAGKLSRELLKEMKAICDTLSAHRITIKGDEAYYPATLFRRIPNKRNLPEYHTIIEEPRAISSLRFKALAKKYTDFAEYMRDFALIVHNAQVFNRPNSGPVKDVLVLKSVFEQELNRLVERGLINKDDTVFPDLGDIPDTTPGPDPGTEDEEDGEDDGEDDDDDDEADDSEDEGKGKRNRRRTGRGGLAGRKRDRSGEGRRGGDGDSRKRRGRPPRVDTPMEARIKAVLKGIRKARSGAGHLKVLAFERLPEKAQNPDYYVEIKEPIAIDLIKRKVKRKKYQSLEDFMGDMELMFSNAMRYNEDESDLYKDAKELWEEARKIAEAERQKPDSEYLMEDGRFPLPNGILHNGELWKVGDWVHIQNPNDVTKPIVAQIYRTWQDSEGQQWVNACWYYRPEQTVHQYEKHFYPNEVVKTGQYRDHHVDELIDRCFVMFVTRYNRGRPRGLDPSKEVYICEARYNEERHRLNKIKTWASCLPDEVRDRDYEMDIFDETKKIKKIPSPIKHLLKPGAKETDEPPSPRWGHENAPPVVGAVHCQPRDENQSPPPEPTPTPPPTPPQRLTSARKLTNNINSQPLPRPSIDVQGVTPGHSSSASRSMAQMTPMTPGSAYRQTSSASPGPNLGRPIPHPQNQSSYNPSGLTPKPSSSTSSYQPNAHVYQLQSTSPAVHPSSYNASLATPSSAAAAVAVSTRQVPSGATTYQQQQQQLSSASATTSVYASGATTRRQPDVYVMSDAANASIPHEIRSQFPCDDRGRILWFTTPSVEGRSVNREVEPSLKGGGDGNANGKTTIFAHTSEYLAAREKRKMMIEEQKTKNMDGKKRRRDDGLTEEEEEEQQEQTTTSSSHLPPPPSPKRRKPTPNTTTTTSPTKTNAPDRSDEKFLPPLLNLVLDATDQWYRSHYGIDIENTNDNDKRKDNDDDELSRLRAFDALRADERLKDHVDKVAYFEAREKNARQRGERETRMMGRMA